MTKRSVQFRSAAIRQLPSAKASNDAGVMTMDVTSASLRVCFATCCSWETELSFGPVPTRTFTIIRRLQSTGFPVIK
jgi:hypothetical protein